MSVLTGLKMEGGVLLSAIIMCVTLSSCSGGVVQRIDDPDRLPAPPPRQGFLKLPQGPDRARIYIDERFMGCFSDYPRNTILLPVGMHRIHIKASGYATIYAQIKISSDRPVSLTGSLLQLSSLSSSHVRLQ